MHRATRHALSTGLAALLLLMTCGCGEDKKTMLFHAGVGQRSSLDEIQALFQERHPDVEVNFSYKGSGYFIADITRSQEGDLYLPGEEFYLLQAVERGFITDYDPERDMAANFITVIITPRGNPANIQKVEDLARPGVRVGLGNPKACAIGLWHEKTFKKAGIWDAVQANATMSAKCIPELGNAAQHKLIDATIVWATTAVLYLRDVEVVPLAPEYRGVVRLPVAVLRFARHAREAEMLKSLILSDDGKEIFQSHAYAVGSIPRDGDGFANDGGKATDPLMRSLVNAARAVKDESFEANADTVGALMKEVVRQRRTTRAGS
ncbi:substrate-binding domain-containing protein [bacterium]|nr:substrate-binding domain-containing protein [bacterium]